MAEWNANASWTPKEQINGGQQFNADDILTPEEFNALVENMQYLYENGGDFEVNPYPIGAIFMSVQSTSPAYLFGGTWERIKDKFLLSAGDSYAAGSSGGVSSHTHGLSNGYAQIFVGGLASTASYDYGVAHTAKTLSTDYTATRAMPVTNSTNSVYTYSDTSPTATALGGNTNSESNMPPYLVVYVWKRTA